MSEFDVQCEHPETDERRSLLKNGQVLYWCANCGAHSFDTDGHREQCAPARDGAGEVPKQFETDRIRFLKLVERQNDLAGRLQMLDARISLGGELTVHDAIKDIRKELARYEERFDEQKWALKFMGERVKELE
jgi:hypothetical protein